MKFLEHIGIAVRDLDQANALYTDLLKSAPYKIEEVESEHVITSFFKVDKIKIELLQATLDGSVIDKYVSKFGEGLHHIAFEVEDIHEEIQRLKKQGFRLIYDEPRRGADNKLITFVHPKSSHGVLVELCQEIHG